MGWDGCACALSLFGFCLCRQALHCCAVQVFFHLDCLPQMLRIEALHSTPLHSTPPVCPSVPSLLQPVAAALAAAAASPAAVRRPPLARAQADKLLERMRSQLAASISAAVPLLTEAAANANSVNGSNAKGLGALSLDFVLAVRCDCASTPRAD